MKLRSKKIPAGAIAFALLASSSTINYQGLYIDMKDLNHLTYDLNNLYLIMQNIMVMTKFKWPIFYAFPYLVLFSSLLLKNILYVPQIFKNLIKVS